jgi:hypothetical protein
MVPLVIAGGGVGSPDITISFMTGPGVPPSKYKYWEVQMGLPGGDAVFPSSCQISTAKYAADAGPHVSTRTDPIVYGYLFGDAVNFAAITSSTWRFV